MRKAPLLVALLLLTATPLVAQEWSEEEQQLVDWLGRFADEAYVGDVDTYMAWFHPDFTAWDYSADAPIDMKSFREMASKFFGAYDSVELTSMPLSVQLIGDVAVMHLGYRETMKESDGVEVTLEGRWTATLKKEGDEWRFLTWTWVETTLPPPPDS